MLYIMSLINVTECELFLMEANSEPRERKDTRARVSRFSLHSSYITIPHQIAYLLTLGQTINPSDTQMAKEYIHIHRNCSAGPDNNSGSHCSPLWISRAQTDLVFSVPLPGNKVTVFPWLLSLLHEYIPQSDYSDEHSKNLKWKEPLDSCLRRFAWCGQFPISLRVTTET